MDRSTQTAVVVGAGAAGLVSALALRAAGAAVTIIAPARRADPRTTALMDGSVHALEALGVWPLLRADAAPLRTLRLIDGTRRLLRAPETTFQAGEAGLAAFAWNVENERLNAALEAARAQHEGIGRIEGTVAGIEAGADSVEVRLDDGRRVKARLVAAADGRDSPVRTALGIAVRSRSYPQVAVTATLAHERPHNGVSTEFHTETGPFTLVPLSGERSSVVCVVTAKEAAALMALDEAAFGLAMEKRGHSLLGRMRLTSGRGAFPLSSRTAAALAVPRVALLGEAAHVLPPIGAQGLNLGLRDAATLAELVADAVRGGGDIGAAALTEAYARRRRADIDSRTLAVDLLNRSLLTDFLPVQGLRGLGLWLFGRVRPLRHLAMREGLGPARDAPRLLSGRPL
ncbi:MAG TPA: UbiH/UbiF family hydroxylase [Xanthobacteraceae bacterium]|nr:UbiH/UbiF family hydroxylase [Xanthobacteraceae bacterium]